MERRKEGVVEDTMQMEVAVMVAGNVGKGKNGALVVAVALAVDSSSHY